MDSNNQLPEQRQLLEEQQQQQQQYNYYQSHPYSTSQNSSNEYAYSFFYPPVIPLKPYDKGYQKYPNSPKYRDIAWLILFSMHLLGVIALFIVSILRHNGSIQTGSGGGHGSSSIGSSGPDTNLLPTTNQNQVYYIIGIAIGISFIFSMLWLLLIKHFAKALIYTTLVISVGMLFALSIFNYIYGNILYGIISLIFTFFIAITIYSWRNRINFSVLILQTVIPILNDYCWGTFVVSLLGLVMQLIWTGFWSFTLILSQDFGKKDINYSTFILMILSYFWTTMVIKYWLHVTVSGSLSTYYFLGENGPSKPTINSLKRASTTSLGSICLGSLFVSIIQTLRQLTYFGGGDSRAGTNILLICSRCILDILDRLLEYFNLYAFVQVAVYGKSYIESAKDTWSLIKSHGLEAVINDSLISGILNCGIVIGGLIVGLCCGFISYHYVPQYYIQITFISVFIAISTLYIMMELIQSSVITLFVCFVMEPNILETHSPLLYQKLTVSYHTW